jgi:hypothetical protein
VKDALEKRSYETKESIQSIVDRALVALLEAEG